MIKLTHLDLWIEMSSMHDFDLRELGQNVSHLTNLTRHQKNNGARSSSQLNVETNLGSMDRMARLKAQAIKNSRA